MILALLISCTPILSDTGSPDSLLDIGGPDAGGVGRDPRLLPRRSWPVGDTAHGFDSGEDLLSWYADDDGDGWGTGEPVWQAAAPVGHVAADGDCDDRDARAWPGQEQFFVRSRSDGGWDFDCDGDVTPSTSALGACDATCTLETEGWSTAAAPACGELGSWISGCSDEFVESCEAISEVARLQGCR